MPKGKRNVKARYDPSIRTSSPLWLESAMEGNMEQHTANNDWKQIVKKYTTPSRSKSSWQLVNSIVPYLIGWFVAFKAYEVHPLLSAAIALFCTLFYLRIFIIFHDCGHGSFFKSKKWRTFWGYFCGVLTFTPYWQWTRTHATHHRHTGNLEKRGIGDVDTATVEEYKTFSKSKKFWYMAKRNPFVMLLGGPILLFMLQYRFTMKEDGARERRSVYITNVLMLLKAIAFSNVFSLEFYLVYEFATVFFGAFFGIYMFYVQHQFEDAYWSKSENWSYVDACLKGSSFLKLPKVLQWGSGNIGFHHIHHLSHRIPNYYLEQAHNENKMFQAPPTLTIGSSLKCLNLVLFDEKQKRMLTHKEYRQKEYRELKLAEA
jgi:omega-6 fatty acid desaturase (delta-12 desaturase)